jgi:hypothetical protein
VLTAVKVNVIRQIEATSGLAVGVTGLIPAPESVELLISFYKISWQTAQNEIK